MAFGHPDNKLSGPPDCFGTSFPNSIWERDCWSQLHWRSRPGQWSCADKGVPKWSLGTRRRTPSSSGPSTTKGSLHEPLRALHPSPHRDHPSDPRHRLVRGRGLHAASRLPAAANRFSHHHGQRESPRGQPGNRRLIHCHAAGTTVRTHRGRHGDDLHQHARFHQHHTAIRSLPQHRRRRARSPGRDQRGTRQPARQSSEQPQLPQGQPGRLPDHDHRADLSRLHARSDVRRRLHHPCAKAFPGGRRGPGNGRREFASRCAGGTQPDRAQPCRHRPGGGAHRAQQRQRERAQGPPRRRHQHLDHHRQRPTLQGGGLHPARHHLSQRRTSPGRRCRRGGRLGRKHPQRRLRQRQALGAARCLARARGEHHQHGRCHHETDPAVEGLHPAGDRSQRGDGAHQHHPRLHR